MSCKSDDLAGVDPAVETGDTMPPVALGRPPVVPVAFCERNGGMAAGTCGGNGVGAGPFGPTGAGNGGIFWSGPRWAADWG